MSGEIMMKTAWIKNKLKCVAAFVLTNLILLGSFPVRAQDIVTSDDIASSSSVFVLRRANRPKSNFAASSQAKRTVAQRKSTRQKIAIQSTAVARVIRRERPTKSLDPQAFAKANADIKRMTPQQAAPILAGAGEYYLERDDLEKAADFFREAVTLDKDYQAGKQGLSDVYTRYGNEFLEADDSDKALSYFTEAIKYNDKNAAAYAGSGEVYDSREQSKEAIANYEKAVALDADLTEVFTPLGILYFQTGEIAKAENYLTKSLAVSADNAETQYFLGLIRLQQNRLDEAAAALRRSLQIAPDNPEAHYYLGEVLTAQNQIQKAMDEYRTATAANPKYAEAFAALGAANVEQKNYAATAEAYKKAVTLKNDNWQWHADLADAYRLDGKLNEAIGEYRIAASRIKDDPALFAKLGFVMGSFGNWNGAIENLSKAAELGKQIGDYTNLGWAYYNSALADRRARSDAAAQTKLLKGRDALEKAIAIDGEYTPALLNLGVVNNELKDYQTAIKTLEKASDATDDKKVKLLIYNERGISYYGLQDYKNAAKNFRKAIDIDDKFAAAQYSLGEVEFRLGDKKEAEKQLKKLQSLNATALARRLQAIMQGAVLK